MPTFLQRFEIDWGWPRLSEGERAIVRRHEARAQAEPATHTLTTLKEALTVASRELPGRVVRARAEDEHGKHGLLARDGQCSDTSADTLDEAGKFPGPLNAADYLAAGVKQLCVGLFWPEGMLRAMETQAVRLNRSLSWLVQKAWVLGQAPSAGPGDLGLPRDGDRRRQSIELPIEIYAELADLAEREDRSMSFLVQRALLRAWPAIITLLAQAG